MSKCGFNIDKDCIETKCHKCKLNPMYQQGTNDTVDKAIELLKEYPLVKAMGEILKLKEQK